jgi:hypothetical protein
MTQEIQDYVVVSINIVTDGNAIPHFRTEVLEHIKKGFTFVGGPFVAGDKLCQAMILTKQQQLPVAGFDDPKAFGSGKANRPSV